MSGPGYPGNPNDPNDPQNTGNYGQYPAPQPQYGNNPYGNQPPVAPKNGLGIAALILGILSILAFWTFGFGILLGVIAVILGFIGRGRVKKGLATNGGVALTGIITGVLGILAGIAFLAVTVWLVNETGAVDYATCISDAGSDQAALDRCNTDFSSNIEDRFSVTVTIPPVPTN